MHRLKPGTELGVSIRGQDGYSVLSGSGSPSTSLGRDNDFYIDTDVMNIYGPKSAGLWGTGVPMTATLDIHALTTKDALVDNDEFILADSESSYANKKTTKQNLFSKIKTYLDSFFVPLTRTINTKALSGNITLTQDDIGDGSTYKQYSSTEKSKLSGIEASADVTDLTNISSSINGASAVTPVDADKFPFIDNDDATIKTVTGANLKTYVGGLPTGGTPGQFLIKDSTTDFDTSWATLASIQDYFLDDSSSDISGYKVLLATPSTTAEDIDTAVVDSGSGEVLIDAYATANGDPNTTILQGGLWTFPTWCKVSNATGTTEIVIRVYKRASGGSETELFNCTTGNIDDTSVALYVVNSTQDDFIVLTTDRIVIKYYAKTTSGASITVSLYHNGTTHYTSARTPVKALTGGSGAVSSVSGSAPVTVSPTTGDCVVSMAAANSTTNGYMTSTYASKLDGVEASADVTDLTNISSSINGASAVTPVDADKFPFIDNDDATIKTVTGANLKTYIGSATLDIHGLTGESAIVSGDEIPFYDLTASANRKITYSELLSALGTSFDLKSGLTGQVLSKDGSGDYSFAWTTPYAVTKVITASNPYAVSNSGDQVIVTTTAGAVINLPEITSSNDKQLITIHIGSSSANTLNAYSGEYIRMMGSDSASVSVSLTTSLMANNADGKWYGWYN